MFWHMVVWCVVLCSCSDIGNTVLFSGGGSGWVIPESILVRVFSGLPPCAGCYH